MAKAGYHQFLNEDDEPYGSFEVFYQDAKHGRTIPAGENPTCLGWYWWACFPGCLPDGEASGPFLTAQEAYDDVMG